jgi:serine/threonine-protein kinase
MELTDSTPRRIEKKETAHGLPDRERVSLFVRMWGYGGPGLPLTGLVPAQDPEVAELISGLIAEAQGVMIEPRSDALVAHFDDSFYALFAAKALQQRLLTFQRKQAPQQVVLSILISEQKDTAPAAGRSPGEIITATQLLADGASSQILVSESIYDLTKSAPGVRFNPEPVREAGEGGLEEAYYELLWTDESTYAHLREAGRKTGINHAGRYQIHAELGRGAMGVVYKAYDHLIGRTVALKTISIDHNTPNREELIERLKQEAKAAGGLDHPNIITIYDVGQEEDLVYLSMQFLEGKTLQTLLDEGQLPPLAKLVAYAEQICSAVGFAHTRGVIHRDLKPSNMMLTSQGIIKVLDFGIAKIENAALTQTGLVVGTPAHMAPEQVAGKKIDHRADVFALGSVFYELFTREKPFRGDVTTILYKIVHEDPVPPSVINPALPGGIDAIIRKALAKDPKDRFQSCEDMVKTFREQAAILKSPSGSRAPVTAGPVPAPRPTASSLSYLLEDDTENPERRISPGILAVLILAIAGATAWAFYVKSTTGSFPLVQRFASAPHQAKPLPASGKVEPPGEKAGDPDGKNSEVKNSAPAAPETSNSSDTAGANAAEATSAPANTSSSPVNPPAPDTTQPPSTTGPAQPQNVVTTPPTPADVAAGQNAPPSLPALPAAKRPQKSPDRSGLNIDGYNRRDVPELVRLADAAAGRGDYRQARFEYDLILRLDRNNAAARNGLRRIQAAEQDSARR